MKTSWEGGEGGGRGGDTPNVVKADMTFDTNKRILHQLFVRRNVRVPT